MIVVDASAIVAIVLDEPERAAFLEALRGADRALVSVASALEARMVVYGRRGPRAVVLLDDMLRLPPFELAPVGEPELAAATAAFVAFGKGSGHPAALNFGDLFSYALAKTCGAPLLFKGGDFGRTDLGRVVG